jgi:hypothetical protein
MPVGQYLSRHQRGILKCAKPKYDVDAVGDVIDKAFGNQDMNANIGVGSLERGD